MVPSLQLSLPQSDIVCAEPEIAAKYLEQDEVK